MDDYLTLDAVGLAGRVRAGEVSPRELVDEALSRIDAQNPALNAVIHRFDPEPFLAALPDDAPLRGVPFLLKDELELAGHPITLGSRLLKGYQAPNTHPVVQRFLDAGLVPLGRTNMSEVGLLPLTEPEAYGPTQNPWRAGMSPGGSSGGSAAAVAAGLVPIAQAGDGGGSIRIPASCCGLVGLKPSRGRHPFDLDDPPQGFVVHLGVSRTVRDAASLLDLVSGGDASLPAPRIAYAQHAQRDPAALRLGVTFTGWFGEPLHPTVEAALRTTASRLEALGHRVEEIAIPFDRERFSEAFRVLWSAAAGSFFQRTQAEAPVPGWLRPVTRRRGVFRRLVGLPLGAAVTETFTRRLGAMDERLSPSDLWHAEQAMKKTEDQLAACFRGVDLWLTAAMPAPPAEVGSLSLAGGDDELQRRLFERVGFTPLANGTGLPALSIPVADAGPLPIGAHLLAPMGREDRLVRLAGQIERAHPWPRLAPGVAEAA